MWCRLRHMILKMEKATHRAPGDVLTKTMSSSKALTLGTLIEPSSELGRKYTALAQTFTGAITKPTPAKKRFVEYFSIVPARYKLADGK